MPPVAFVVVFITILLVSRFLSKFAECGSKKGVAGSSKPYACGEDFVGNRIQPDYSQFFPFAFFFTIIHVVALTIWMVPKESVETLAIASVYILATAIGLLILMRK